ncbi:hypothetical protein J7J26_01705 [Candidatus Micrarchaeota archaeon]|nr:hypothetical protein [Candidatus Micrarchaeota archaeon]
MEINNRLGKPVKCTFDYTDQRSGQLTHAIMYVKGKDIRIEITSDQMSAVEIIKGDTVYLKSSKGKETIPGCDWIKMEMNKSITGNETATEAVSPEKIEGKTNYHCELNNFGDDKFQVSGGTICDLNEIIKKMQAEQENKSIGG